MSPDEKEIIAAMAAVMDSPSPEILWQLALAAGEDGQVSPEENQVIAAMVAVMDFPSPKIFCRVARRVPGLTVVLPTTLR